jgi:myosin heavy subunit
MEIVNDAELLNNISIRYNKDLICTYVGPTLLVFNPFNNMSSVINDLTKFNYIGKIAINKGNYKDLPPLIYSVAAEAFRNLVDSKKN